MIWTSELLAEFRQLWDAGLSTVQIGKKFGCTKNSIVGKARRLEFPPRPSPVKRGDKPVGWVSNRPRPVALPPLRSLSTPAVAPLVESTPAAPPRPVVAVKPKPVLVRACEYLIGGRPDRKACGDVTEPGRPYCEAHCRVCFVSRAA